MADNLEVLPPASKKMEELVTSISTGLQSWIKAGEILVDLLDNEHYTLEYIVDTCKSDILTVDRLQEFERIGRKQLRPELLISRYPAARHMLTLTYSDQVKYDENPVAVVVTRDGDKTDVLQIATKNLTKPQCKQVFEKTASGNRVRSEAAQKAWLESERTKASTQQGTKTKKATWEIRDGKLVIHVAPITFTRKEVMAMLQTMEK